MIYTTAMNPTSPLIRNPISNIPVITGFVLSQDFDLSQGLKIQIYPSNLLYRHL